MRQAYAHTAKPWRQINPPPGIRSSEDKGEDVSLTNPAKTTPPPLQQGAYNIPHLQSQFPPNPTPN